MEEPKRQKPEELAAALIVGDDHWAESARLRLATLIELADEEEPELKNDRETSK